MSGVFLNIEFSGLESNFLNKLHFYNASHSEKFRISSCKL